MTLKADAKTFPTAFALTRPGGLIDSGVRVLAAPSNLVAPTIEGNPNVGSVLTANTGAWAGYPSPSFAYAWKLDGVANGATGSTYTPVSGDLGKVPTCTVSASNSEGGPISVTTAARAAIGAEIPVASAPVNTVAPAISGSANVGSTLTLSDGVWTGYPTPTFTRQWYWFDTMAPISGATGSTYVPVSGDVGHTIIGNVIAANPSAPGGVSAASAATAAVTSFNPDNTETATYLAAMTVEPTLARKTTIDTLVSSLKSAGVWTKLDALYLLASHDAQAARLNLVSPSAYALTAYNSPVFTPDRGYTTNGALFSTASYLDTGFAPRTAAGKLFAQNSSHLGIWSESVIKSENLGSLYDVGVWASNDAGDGAVLANIDNTLYTLGYSSGADGTAVTNSSGHAAWSRTGSTQYKQFRNGSVIATVSKTSDDMTTVGTSTFYLGGFNSGGINNPSARQYGFLHFGSGLSDAEMAALETALDAYRTDIRSANTSPLVNWQAAKALRLAGTRNARIHTIGDSTTYGAGAASLSLSWPTKLAALLRTAGVPAYPSSHIGASVDLSAEAYDARLTLGSWTGADIGTIGSQFYTASNATGGAWSFTPTQSVDTFEIYYLTSSGLGTWSYDVDGGSATTVTPTSSPASIGKLTISAGSLGAHTLHLNWVSGTAYILGAHGYNSAAKEVSIYNSGWSGSKAQSWGDPTYSARYTPVAGGGVLAPDLTIICLGINDWQAGTDISLYTSQLQYVIDLAKPYGDVMLLTPVPSGSAVPQATQQTYIDVIYALAATNNLPLVDAFAHFGSYATANGNGWMADTLHPSATGYQEIADLVSAALI